MKLTNIILSITAMLSVCPVIAASTHRMATFNIRYTGDATDTEGKSWAARGQEVINLIKEYDFDIVSLQEVCGHGYMASYAYDKEGRSSKDCIEQGLDTYNTLFYDCAGSDDKGYIGLAYKKNLYEELDKGAFYVSTTPEKYSQGWDISTQRIARRIAWIKLRVKTTSEIFFFVAVHTNDGWSLDGVYGGDLVAKTIDSIAGGYPVMLTGDFNMQRIPSNNKSYKAYRSLYYDANETVPADKNTCLPTDGPQIKGTYNGFNTADSGYNFLQLDYHFYRRMNVLERHIITKGYEYNGSDCVISDHFPILVVAELQAPLDEETSTIYVDRSAPEGGNGSMLSPLNSINKATEKAEIGMTIKVTADEYNESINLDKSIILQGGFDKSFSNIIGKTTLSGKGLGQSPVYIPDFYSLTMSDFIIRDYTAPEAKYDGAIHFRGCDLNLTRVDFINNEATTYGGAISALNNPDDVAAATNNIHLTDCKFYGNSAIDGGALAFSSYIENRISGCIFKDNHAQNCGGAIYAAYGVEQAGKIPYTRANVIISNSSIVTNSSGKSGAIYINDQMSYVTFNIVNTSIANNTLDSPSGLPSNIKKYGGAAIHAILQTNKSATKSACLNIGHSSIVGNAAMIARENANFSASAINISGGATRIMNSIVAGNYTMADHNFHDIMMDETAVLDKFTSNIYSNMESVNVKTDEKSIAAESRESYLNNFPKFIKGNLSGNIFTAELNESKPTSYIEPLAKEYNGKNAAFIKPMQRNLEVSFKVDLDGDGKVGNQLKNDQNYTDRVTDSMIGAVELTDVSSVSSIPEKRVNLVKISRGVYKIPETKDIKVYDTTGRLVVNSNNASNDIIDVSSYSPGIYILVINNIISYKIFN